MRERVPVLAIVVVAVLILGGAIVPPPPHEVHTPGAGALNTRTVGSDPPVISPQAIQPSQSLNNVRCAVGRALHPHTSVSPHAPTPPNINFPSLTLHPRPLRVPRLAAS